MFRTSRRTKRRICGAMVFVWLFAVTSSVANACVVSESPATDSLAHMRHEHRHADDSAEDGHHHHEDAASFAEHWITGHHATAVSHDHPDSHAGCHKFCKDESTTLTKSKHLESPDFSHLLIDTRAPRLPAPVEPMTQRESARPYAQGPPLSIRFLRLTL